MRNFYRALKKSVEYWPTICLAAVCSFSVAALWGANIGGFYPILEVTMRGKSMHQWIDEEIAKTEAEISELNTQRVELEKRIAVFEGDETDPQLVSARSDLLENASQVSTLENILSGHHKLEPWIRAWAPNDPFQTITYVVIALMISTLIKHVFLVSNEVLVGRVALDISRDIRMQVFEKAMGLDRAAYSNYGTSRFTSTITHTTDMLSNGLMNTLGAAIREPLKVVSCLVGAGLICWRLLLLSVVIAPVVGVLLYMITRRLREVSHNQLTKAEGFHAVMLESLANVNTVQSYRREQTEVERFSESTFAMRTFGLRFIFYTSLTKPVIEFLGLGMLSTTIVGGAYLVLNQETHLLGIPICEQPLSVPALLVFFGMLIGVSDPLRKLSAVYSTIYAGCIAADSLYPMLDHENTVAESKNPVKVAGRHSVLRFEDVNFGYTENQEIVKNINLDIPYGATVGIVGHNGSGKSTLIHLLSRFYDPTQGKITVDGVDYRDMAIDDVRKRIALVTQSTELFNDSVAYNIKYGCPEATDEEMLAASRTAHAHDFISEVLEDGYDTVVGQNGNRLSGGQRQRIALARALLCDPEILILDEATSQIDMKSEQLIRESLANNKRGRTMIIITHREKLLELADDVYEVIDGQLIQNNALIGRAA